MIANETWTDEWSKNAYGSDGYNVVIDASAEGCSDTIYYEDKREEDLPPLEIPEFPDESADPGLLWAQQRDQTRLQHERKGRVVQKPGDGPGRLLTAWRPGLTRH